MTELVVVWDGNVQAAHRGQLATMPEVLRPAPPLLMADRSASRGRTFESPAEKAVRKRLELGPATIQDLARSAHCCMANVRHMLTRIKAGGTTIQRAPQGRSGKRGPAPSLLWIEAGR